MNDLQKQMMFELLRNRYNSYECDLINIKNHIQLCNLSPTALQDFIVCQARLDTTREIIRALNTLFSAFCDNL